MTFTTIQNGAQSAYAIPDSSKPLAVSRTEVRSLADLLIQLNNEPTSQLPMLRSTAAKVAAFLGKSVEEVSLDLVHAHREGFRPFLQSQRYKEGSIRSYVNYLRILMQSAEELGWGPFMHQSSEWKPVLDLAKKNYCLALAKVLAETKKTPADVTQDDLNRWAEVSIARGIRYVTVKSRVNAAWRTLISCGYTRNAPPSFLRRKNYGVPVSEFPPRLREEVNELIRWKTADFEEDRPKEAKIREISATKLRRGFSCLYGYATNIAGLADVGCLEQLLQKQIVGGFVKWSINVQKVLGKPLASQFGCILVAVQQHPNHQSLDLSWFRPLLKTIPIEPYDAVKARKAKKYLPYDVLAAIPGKIHAKRKEAASRGEEHLARLVMEELMMSWLLVFPWRQRNLRECRVAGPDPNLFKGKVPEFSDIDKPVWVLNEEAKNSNAEFWQVRFAPEETKTASPVHTLVPRQLVPLLEEYLSDYRPVLMKGRSWDTLFIMPEADTVSDSLARDSVSDLTLRYGGRRVTPHLFRDVVAFAWLKAHPKDYLTLSKMLWHKDLATTIGIYGSRFNESSAAVAMESWLEERELGAKQK